MRAIFLAAIVASSTAPALADFQMDKTSVEIRNAIKKPAIIDLAVGETGLKQRPIFCVEGNQLFVLSELPLDDEPAIYGLSYKLKRMPGDTVSLTATMGKVLKRDSIDLAIADTLNDAMFSECDSQFFAGKARFAVSDINGKTKVSDFLPK